MPDILIACCDVMDSDSIEKRTGDYLYVRKFSAVPENLKDYFPEKELTYFVFEQFEDQDLLDKMNRKNKKIQGHPYAETMKETDEDGIESTVIVQRSRIKFDMTKLSDDDLSKIKDKKHVYTKLHKRDEPVMVRS